MNKFVFLTDLNAAQSKQYGEAILAAFPAVISQSPTIIKLWSKLEKYFPQFQLFLLNPDEEILGFMNTVPFRFDEALGELPDTGWDWMLSKGISDYEQGISPNYLGGLQVIVRNEYQGQGNSKLLLKEGKNLIRQSNLQNLVIPIRPTKKHLYPKMAMTEYIELKEQNQIFDPWIRTHMKSGAQMVKVCEQSMTITGNLDFWEGLFDKKITRSGEHILDRALRPITIDLDKNHGAYIEPNIWIYYD